MKIFILEDNKERIKIFEESLIGHELFIAKDVQEAKKILKQNNYFPLIFLDHDLENRVFVPSEEENTGYAVAKFINENNVKYSHCIIHSLNPVGASNMNNILKNSIKIPFLMLNLKNLLKG